ncbi:SH3 domain protein [Paecilomyces variotii No. 5]|uniref:SH3 domain protein n=1 Tax=Byssochlamys spectabilis (strain No. 5 / NBRC 109023) TaxID=1356009 RepID=V5FS13_BYSSN|nr:SH3 domain protein [Paecilomyces variotii No. 5]
MSSPPTSPPEHVASQNLASLSAPLGADKPVKRGSLQRPNSYTRDRLSTYSTASLTSQTKSRPVSYVIPAFHSSLPYTLVRDFAYPPVHPLHYGPPPVPSGVTTPMSENRRLSDPPPSTWDSSRGQWSTGPWTTENIYGNQQLPAMSFGDGPPYSEDEDLHSPVVTTSRHRKNRSGAGYDGRRGRSPGDSGREYTGDDRGQFISMNGDGSETYYVREEGATEDGPGGEFVTYPASESRYSHLAPGAYGNTGVADYAKGDQYFDPDMLDSDDEISDTDGYSRDYEFSIASPDEEMHGKAVALFDFTREHENELPLKEGQVILVSYRHGQGWLVAEDPKTGESGLVPEEFVRLLRHIEGGLTSLNGEINNAVAENNPDINASDAAADEFLSQSSLTPGNGQSNGGSGSSSEKHPSVISRFSTSSKDLDPYPSHLLGGSQGKTSPQPTEESDDNRTENGISASTMS